jgi:hypothetical protein
MYRRFLSLVLVVGLIASTIIACPTLSMADSPEKAKAQEVVGKLKGVKIITIQDRDKFNAVDQWSGRALDDLWRPGVKELPVTEYDRNYVGRLKEYLGIELIVVRSGELLEEMAKVDPKEQAKLADLWIREATEMKVVSRQDVLRAAKLYFGLRALVKKYDAVAITFESATLSLLEKKVDAWPPLAILELSKEHIPCSCQCHIDGLVTQLIGSYLTDGRQGYLGDVLNDWTFKPTGDRPENVIVVAHCGAPINPYGNDRIPYLIRDHIHNQWSGPYPTGHIPTATTVVWPVNKSASVIKFDVYRKRVSIYTGTVLDGNALYVDFPNCVCRNKIVVQIDNPDQCYMLPSSSRMGIFRHWDGSWGGHQVAFYGNLREEIRNFAALTGFELVEGK